MRALKDRSESRDCSFDGKVSVSPEMNAWRMFSTLSAQVGTCHELSGGDSYGGLCTLSKVFETPTVGTWSV